MDWGIIKIGIWFVLGWIAGYFLKFQSRYYSGGIELCESCEHFTKEDNHSFIGYCERYRESDPDAGYVYKTGRPPCEILPDYRAKRDPVKRDK